jgi:hypothetical protein
MPARTVTSQVFFFLRLAEVEGALAFTTDEGVTVPFFSSSEEAQQFLEKHALEGFQVELIPPMQWDRFSAACSAAGATFLQLDPQDNSLTNATFSQITFGDSSAEHVDWGRVAADPDGVFVELRIGARAERALYEEVTKSDMGKAAIQRLGADAVKQSVADFIGKKAAGFFAQLATLFAKQHKDMTYKALVDKVIASLSEVFTHSMLPKQLEQSSAQ